MRSIICFWVMDWTSVQALGHITFWVCVSIRSVAWHKGRTRATFPKCFIDFRAIYRWSERRYSYQSTEHIHQLTWDKFGENTCSPQNIYTKQKALLLQDSVYLQDICLDQISTENRIKVKRNYAKHHLLLSFGLNFCSSPRSISISQLNTLLCLHPWPIKLVVYKWPYSF